ncbi:isoquinoline 1-oxidoreductase alpha subunit [Litorivivens lipolytica]|uniref:Isoquinoline 1-oxidoreductase alpha subunit n=1 Tax=Litorivivens lipolytica TaxID=1524264 RepID=A0A7W4Z4G4_9GAMM|nr:(2Fe-2S)-binding protein [Litorivivens lipolytica]MBB3046052.1 isoquinoline 1-oxidoreductase alpha subunit [Litorivivens lipolytica]
MTKETVVFTVNDRVEQTVVSPEKPLLWVLRDELDLTGSKYGCGRALCGACTVHVDGQPTRACVTPVKAVEGKRVTTIEALSETELGARVQRAWKSLNVPQCGYCQSGQIMAVVALLRAIPKPTDQNIDEALSGNICRCGMYPRIRKAVHELAAGGFA